MPSLSVGMVGYGRFGGCFADLLESAGVEVRAFDRRVDIPVERRANSPSEVAAADVIILAVPVAELGAALRELAPHLSIRNLVVDVGSVKLGPVEAMGSILGTAVPWVGAHPLFGPISIAKREPLRVVVCPNPIHPSAAGRARELFERVGCIVIEADADSHDRAMADTHALAFFVARGMLDAGVDPGRPEIPPSFQPMARMIESVRADGGRLFDAIQIENRYARSARRRLIAALIALDASIADRDD